MYATPKANNLYSAHPKETYFPFLELPAELRYKIYEIALRGRELLPKNSASALNAFHKQLWMRYSEEKEWERHVKHSLALTTLDRQIREESRLLPFPLNSFSIDFLVLPICELEYVGLLDMLTKLAPD
jgi:hypothetical protein